MIVSHLHLFFHGSRRKKRCNPKTVTNQLNGDKRKSNALDSMKNIAQK
jgi:hypothetical protein